MGLLRNISNLLRKSASAYTIFESALFASSKSNWSAEDYLKAYQISNYANGCIRKRAEKVGQIEFFLKQGEKIIRENNEYLDVLYRPNPFQTKSEFFAAYQTYKDLSGSAYILILRRGEKPVELYLLRPDCVSYETSNVTGQILEYKFRKPSGTIVRYNPKDIIASHYFNPLEPIGGMSLLTAGINIIRTEKDINEYQGKVMRNGGRVEGVFTFDTDNFTSEQLETIKDSYKKQYAQARKAGLPLFLSGKADYKNLALSPHELAFLESKKVTLNDILFIFGVPKMIMAQTEDVQYNNADASIRIFLRETVKPLMDNLNERLNEFLIPKQYELAFVNPVPEDQEQRRGEIKLASEVGALTINEKRKLLGLEPLSGKQYDQVLIPFNLMPASEIYLDSNQQKLKKKEQFSDENHPLKDEYVRQKYFEVFLKRLDRQEKQFGRVVNQYFSEQRQRLVEKLTPAKTRSFRKKNLLGEVFTLAAEVKFAKDQFLPILREILIDSGQKTLEFIGAEKDFIFSGAIGGWLDKKIDIFSNSINETTFEKLKEEFAESFANGESRQQLVKRIEDTYSNISKIRAKMIARTEVLGVSQYGNFEAYKQVNIGIKIWVAVMDGRTRDSHASIDGEERPIDIPFSNGLMFPGDPNGPAEEVINCRCTI